MSKHLSPLLEIIDESLALDGVSVDERPFRAAFRLVRDFVTEVKPGRNEEPVVPGDCTEFASAPWFSALFGHVEAWYRRRYGSRLDHKKPRHIRGVTLIAGTPFELRVPTTVVYPGVPGETAWLTFPPRVLEEEDAAKWIVELPNLDHYEVESRRETILMATGIASRLRAISCRLTGAEATDDVVKNLLEGVPVHLESASSLILREKQEGGFGRAQWEIQMACESAYKALLQQWTGGFKETHDIFRLHDLGLPHTSEVPRDLLRRLPQWREAVAMRYGQGDQPTVIGIFEWYKTALTIIAEVLRKLKGLDLSNARIEIRKAPWLSS